MNKIQLSDGQIHITMNRGKKKVNGDVMASMPTRMLSTNIRTTSLSGITSRTNFPQPLNRSNQK